MVQRNVLRRAYKQEMAVMTEITQEDCKIVRELCNEGLSEAIIAHRFGMTTTHVRNIRNVPDDVW